MVSKAEHTQAESFLELYWNSISFAKKHTSDMICPCFERLPSQAEGNKDGGSQPPVDKLGKGILRWI